MMSSVSCYEIPSKSWNLVPSFIKRSLGFTSSSHRWVYSFLLVWSFTQSFEHLYRSTCFRSRCQIRSSPAHWFCWGSVCSCISQCNPSRQKNRNASACSWFWQAFACSDSCFCSALDCMNYCKFTLNTKPGLASSTESASRLPWYMLHMCLEVLFSWGTYGCNLSEVDTTTSDIGQSIFAPPIGTFWTSSGFWCYVRFGWRKTWFKTALFCSFSGLNVGRCGRSIKFDLIGQLNEL